MHFLVKWKGYPTSDNSWEPQENLHADELIADVTTHTIFFFFTLFITCTFTVGHMTDNLLLSHMTHHSMTHVDLHRLTVTHWCFTHSILTLSFVL